MRERLTAAFVLLAVVLMVGVAVARSYADSDQLRGQDGRHLRQTAHTLEQLVDLRIARGGRVDAAFLQGVVGPEDRIVWAPDDGPEVVVAGSDHDGDGGGDLRAGVLLDEGGLTVGRADRRPVDLLRDDLAAVVALALLGVLLAAAVGLLVSHLLAAPFRRLARAADALERGRYDLDLPRTRVPEARAIAGALRCSAEQLRDRLARDRAFAAYTSHALRSPLTGVRLELEDLSLREDVPADVRDVASRSVDGLDQVAGVAGDLVELQRGILAEGAAVPLHELATKCAQRWADVLGRSGRTVTAAVEGALDRTYSPGPVEQVLDLVLQVLVRRGRGEVRLVLDGTADGHLRITVTAESAKDGEQRYAEVREACEALGGRMIGSSAMDGLLLLLPRR